MSTVTMSKEFLFQTIQFSISMQLVIFNKQIGPYQVLPFRARVDPGAMAMKGCSAFPKATASLEPHHQIIQCHIQDTCWGGVLLLCRVAVGVFYSLSRMGNLNPGFSLFLTGCHINAKWLIMPYLRIAGRREDGLMPFPRSLALEETQITL